MKTLALLCNIVLIGFTLLVMLTEGGSNQLAYIIYGWILLVVPVLNIVLISADDVMNRRYRRRTEASGTAEQQTTVNARWFGFRTKVAAVLWNILLLGFTCWALIDQYPHPDEEGVLAYTIIVIATPIVSILALLIRGVREKVKPLATVDARITESPSATR